MADFRIIEENLRVAMRFFGEALASGEVCSLGKTVAMYSGLDYGVFNIALLTGPLTQHDGGLEAALAEAARFFKERTPRWSFWLCEDLLDSQLRRRMRQTFHDFGLRPISYPPGMFASELAPPLRPLPGIECRPVADEVTRCLFAEITSISFEIPVPVVNAVYTPERAWKGDYQGFVGSVDGRPVAITAIVSAAGALGVYSLGTLPAARRRGYGEALLRAAVAEVARRTGPQPLVLQSTEAGHALYRRMGFRDATKFTVYLTR